MTSDLSKDALSALLGTTVAEGSAFNYFFNPDPSFMANGQTFQNSVTVAPPDDSVNELEFLSVHAHTQTREPPTSHMDYTYHPTFLHSEPEILNQNALAQLGTLMQQADYNPNYPAMPSQSLTNETKADTRPSRHAIGTPRARYLSLHTFSYLLVGGAGIVRDELLGRTHMVVQGVTDAKIAESIIRRSAPLFHAWLMNQCVFEDPASPCTYCQRRDAPCSTKTKAKEQASDL